MPIYQALEANADSIQHTLTRHEQGAGFAAEGYSRASGDVAAVCTVTGIGLTNTLTPMASAMADSVPMVVISSEVPEYWHQRPSRQYSHQVRHLPQVVDGAFAKASFHVTHADDVFSTTMRAVQLAKSGRPGPVHISVGIDALKQQTSSSSSSSSATAAVTAAKHKISPPPLAPPAPAEQLVREAAHRLSACRHPLVIAGGGATTAPELVKRVAERLGAPVLTTVAGKGVLPEVGPNKHALAAGARLHFPSVHEALLEKADGVLLLGTQLSPTDYWQFKHDEEIPEILTSTTRKTLVHVNLDPENLRDVGVEDRFGGVAVEADVGAFCDRFLDALSLLPCSPTSISTSSPPRPLLEEKAAAATKAEAAKGKAGAWGGDAGGHVARAIAATDAPRNMTGHLLFDFESQEGGGSQMRGALHALRAALPVDSPLVADVCRIGYSALSLYPAPAPRSFIYPVGTTTLGGGLPMAIGAAMARPGRCVGLIAGDGGFQFTMNELSVAVTEQLPLLMVIWNDA